VSHILLQAGDTPTDNLSIARVEVEPNSHQQPHHHVPERAYIIVNGNGNGRIKVGSEIADVRGGDLIYIPSHVDHAVENAGPEKLIYISVTVPAFDIEALYDTGQLKR
jgi:mannose-6-phosphate isomerase-like protein (cupin superfamily)